MSKAMEAVCSRYTHANKLAKSLSGNKQSINTLTQAIADSLAAGMQTKDMDGVMTPLRVQVQTRQRARNKLQNDNLAIQTMKTARTMARLGVWTSDVSDILCQVLQHGYTHREMKQLRHQFSKQAHQALATQIASQHAGSIGKGKG